MTESRDLPHIVYVRKPGQIPYTSPRSVPQKKVRQPRNPEEHASRLLAQLEQSWTTVNHETLAVAVADKDGTYLSVDLADDCEDILKTLDPAGKGARLCNYKKVQIQPQDTEGPRSINTAIIFIPDTERQDFIQKLTDYRDKRLENGIPKNNALVASINSIQQAMVKALWTDDERNFPSLEKVWCEIWLDVPDQNHQEDIREHFFSLCDELNIIRKRESLFFPNICVLAVLANHDDLQLLLQRSSQIDEIRKLKDTGNFFTHSPVREQAEWVKDLLARIKIDSNSQVVVGLLDTGVNYRHMLLKPFINEDKCDAIKQEWGKGDHKGHGTEMAGLAAFGDTLFEILQDQSVNTFSHTLSSVKLLPPEEYGENPYELWGDFTKQAVSRLTIMNAGKTKIVCMPITGPSKYEPGHPSSWSAAVDQIAFGVEGQIPTLVFISAGNILKPYAPYPKKQCDNPIENPAQAWNAVTVGAYTQLTTITDDDFKDRTVVAQSGQLSPFSTTSCTWSKVFPFKPEIVMEGGNAFYDNEQITDICDDLSILTTNRVLEAGAFTTTNMTSAATALAANLAARIQAEYPDYWPETIRALLIHSAEWTTAMKDQFLPSHPNKSDYVNLLRTVGYGVPDFNRAIRCAKNSLTIVAQKEIQPFIHESGHGYHSNEMHLFELPWPEDELLALGEKHVSLKVTLSYFIEPGPGEKSYKNRYKYSSHGLDFDINAVAEDKDAFVLRINKKLQDEQENYQPTGESASDNWLLGSSLRTHSGSIHSDVWEGRAADLATSKYIAVYPVIGWWRERHGLNKANTKTRYALVISLSVDEDVDLYTPVANALKVPVDVSV